MSRRYLTGRDRQAGCQLMYRGSKTTRLAVFIKIKESKPWKGATVCHEVVGKEQYNVLRLGTAVLRVRL